MMKPHDSHKIFLGACESCGVRDTLAEIEDRCGVHVHLHERVSLLQFLSFIPGFVIDFATWWQANHEGRKQRSVDEWLAQLIEYRRQNRMRNK